MNEELLNQLAAAVMLAMSRVDLVRSDQILVLETALERMRVSEEVDLAALVQLVGEA